MFSWAMRVREGMVRANDVVRSDASSRDRRETPCWYMLWLIRSPSIIRLCILEHTVKYAAAEFESHFSKRTAHTPF